MIQNNESQEAPAGGETEAMKGCLSLILLTAASVGVALLAVYLVKWAMSY